MMPEFLNVLNTAFEVSLAEGLRMYSKNKKLLNDEQSQGVVDGLLTRLDNTLQWDFDGAVSLLKPIFGYTQVIRDDGTRRLMGIVSARIMPKFSELPTPARIGVLQKISDVSRLCDQDLLNRVFDVFLTIPKTLEEVTTINMSILEAVLWDLIKLGREYPSTASQLFGTVLVLTGQPGEYENAKEDPEQRQEFVSRIQVIQTISKQFVDNTDGQIEFITELRAANDEAKAEKMRQIETAKLAKRTGNNCLHLCRLLLGDSPLTGQLPAAPSWFRTAPTQGGMGKNSERRKPK
jgi:hypothetical protein